MASRRQPRPKKRKKRIAPSRARVVRPTKTFTRRAAKPKKRAKKKVVKLAAKRVVRKTTRKPKKALKRGVVKRGTVKRGTVKRGAVKRGAVKKAIRVVKRVKKRSAAKTKGGGAKKVDTRIRRPRKPTRVSAPKKRARARTPALPPPKKRRPVRRPTSRRPKTRPKVASAKKRSIRPTGKQQAAITRARLRFLTSRPPTTPGRQEIYDRNRAALIQSLLNAGYSPASVRARVGWITRLRGTVRVRVAQARIAALGTARLTGRTREDWYTLRAMIEERDDRYARFLAAAKREGLSLEQAKDEWFSPDMLE